MAILDTSVIGVGTMGAPGARAPPNFLPLLWLRHFDITDANSIEVCCIKTSIIELD